MSYVVYILESEKDGRRYIGQTSDLEKRLKRHNNGSVMATRNRRPLKVVYSEIVGTRAEAVQKEKYFKSLKGGNEIRKLLF